MRKFQSHIVAIVLTCVAQSPAAEPERVNDPPKAEDQKWNLHVQNTEIVQGYPGINSKYSGVNSLPSGGQTRESISLDLMAGLRLWRGAEAHIDGMMWQGFGVNNTRGIAGFPNGEAFRLGSGVPNGAITRFFLRQTIGFGGEEEAVPDQALFLAGRQDVSRLTLTVGRMSAKDIFDGNIYANDPRTQFMNWALMANEAWDYPADAIGYTTGFAAELNEPVWTLRYGLFQLPRVSNGLTAEDRIFKWPYDSSADDGPILKAWGMVLEFERRYSLRSHPGAVRILTYLNRANMGNYQEAVDNPARPADLIVTRDFRYKYGFGLNVEQEVAKSVGVFTRLGWSDGKNEAWVFSDVDWTATGGVSVKGEIWGRPNDTVGLAGIVNGISRTHQSFFEAGGIGILAGDGKLTYEPEEILETYYNFEIWKTIHASLDYQLVNNPAFNSDRGPVHVFAGRVHWEF